MYKLMFPLCLVMLFSSFEAFADKFCWQDKNGVMVYSNRPRDGISEEKMEEDRKLCKKRRSQRDVAKGSSDKKVKEEISVIVPDVTADNYAVYNEEQTKLEAQIKKEEAARKEQNKKYCDDLRLHLAQLRNVARLTMVDENGISKIIDDEERKLKISKAEQDIASNCN